MCTLVPRRRHAATPAYSRGSVRAGATGAIAPVDFQKIPFAPVDFPKTF